MINIITYKTNYVIRCEDINKTKLLISKHIFVKYQMCLTTNNQNVTSKKITYKQT